MYILSYISYLPLCQSYDIYKPMTVILMDRLWACTLQYFVTHLQSQSFKVEWKYFDKNLKEFLEIFALVIIILYYCLHV